MVSEGLDRDIKQELPGVHIKTFGCQMNEHDTAKLYKILDGSYVQVGEPEKARILLINTCSVREKPEHKLYSLLGKYKLLKDRDPSIIVGVGGCVAQHEGEKIIKRSPAVDFVFGTHNLSLVPSLIAQAQKGVKAQVAVDYRNDWEELPFGVVEDNPVSVMVSISRGCNKWCSYCIVPQTRGPEVSRGMEEILREVRLAVHHGAKEVVLLGQTVNSYGRDLIPSSTFSLLLDQISQVEKLERIRFMSPHPEEVDEGFIDCMAAHPKICRHIHMPLQSGSNNILLRMNRNYTRERYLWIIERLKEKLPRLAVTTDIIVGFPGETQIDFEDTLDIMERVQFDGSFSFIYSPRPGTAAAEFSQALSNEEALARLHELQSKQEEIGTKNLREWIGKDVEVLLDARSKADKECCRGRISQNTLVNLQNGEKEISPGMLVEARITEASRFTLRGKFKRIIRE